MDAPRLATSRLAVAHCGRTLGRGRSGFDSDPRLFQSRARRTSHRRTVDNYSPRQRPIKSLGHILDCFLNFTACFLRCHLSAIVTSTFPQKTAQKQVLSLVVQINIHEVPTTFSALAFNRASKSSKSMLFGFGRSDSAISIGSRNRSTSGMMGRPGVSFSLLTVLAKVFCLYLFSSAGPIDPSAPRVSHTYHSSRPFWKSLKRSLVAGSAKVHRRKA